MEGCLWLGNLANCRFKSTLKERSRRAFPKHRDLFIHFFAVPLTLRLIGGLLCAVNSFHAVLEHGGQTNLTYKALSLPDLAGRVRLSNGFACGLLLAALQKGSEGAYLRAMNLQN